jgi:uncharacterized delta-60 repeat protein
MKTQSLTTRFATKLLAAAFCWLANSFAFALIDYPGQLDDTFGSEPENFTSTRLNGVGATLFSIATQPDGKILVAGRCSNLNVPPFDFQMCVGRLSSSGILDSSYGTAGVFRLNEAGVTQSTGARLALLPDGSAVVAATCGETAATQRPCLVRLTPNGSKDASFGSNGFSLATNGFIGDVKALLVRKSGKLVVLGECSLAICVAQYSSNGTLETAFRTTWGAATGIVTFRPTAVVEEADNRLAIVGTCFTSSGGVRGCAVRYYALDGGGSGGDPLGLPYVWDTDEASEGQALALHADGGWLLAGECTVSSVRRYCVRKLLPNGTLDAAFGNAGIVQVQLSTLDHALRAIAVQPDGKISLVGTCRTPSFADYVYCVARLQQDGRLDTSFGFDRDGREVIPLDQFAVSVSSATLQRDGQLLVGGGSGAMTVFRLRGGWFGAKQCDLDVDGDNVSGTTNDVLLAARASMGFTDSALLQGVTFAAHASRTSWLAIRDYLVTQCGMSLQP